MPGEDDSSGSEPCISGSQTDGKDVEGGTAGSGPPDEVRELVRRAQDGDREAFGELYRLHHGRVFRLARASLGASGAEDAAAETFVRAWESLPRYRDTGAPFAAWLYGIARHVVADAGRSRRRLVPWARPPEGTEEAPAPEGRMDLARAVRRLPREQRRVVEMKFLMGLSNGEVGRALGKSPGAVNTQQWRALERLRRLMEDG